MTPTLPTIAQAYAKNRAAFIQRTPFGHLLPDDEAALIKATARDAGVSVKAVKDWQLRDLLQKSAAAVNAMNPTEYRAMIDAQSRSFVRAEAGFGSDADEAAYRAAHQAGDYTTLERLEAEAQARIRTADAAMEAHTPTDTAKAGKE